VPLPPDIRAEEFGVFAGVLPEDKYALVQAFQRGGHVVGMCGDGANDAPALPAGADGHRRLHRDRCCKIGGRHCADRTRPWWYRRSRAGRAHDIPANFDLHVSVYRPQGRPGALFACWTGYLWNRCTDTVADGADDGCRRFLRTVIGNRQCPGVIGPQCLADRQPHISGIILGFCDLVFCIASLAVGRFALNLDSTTLRTLTVVTLVTVAKRFSMSHASAAIYGVPGPAPG